jgi:hypothetical protein
MDKNIFNGGSMPSIEETVMLLDILKLMKNQYPNDQEFGKFVRSFLNNLK